jgi:glycosyltransferase involved in cell wall biosynthesis
MPNPQMISVVIPALNEEENIEPVYERLRTVAGSLPHFRWEFIIVDDGSSDHTLDRVIRLRERDPRVCALSLSRNFGSYAAIRAGFDHARGDAVISISADLQDPPELFRALTQRWQEGFDIVWAVREQRDDRWGKKLAAGVFYRLLRRLALANLPDQGMDCGLFDRRVIDLFRRIRDRNNIVFMTLYWMGFRQARVSYHRRARERGASKWPLGKRVKSALDVITNFSYLPLRVASYLGILVSTVAFLGAAIVLFDRVILGVGGLGWPSLMITILFLGGVQMIMLGIIGEYLWRINSEVRGMPQYLIMRRLGFDSPVTLDASHDALGPEFS